MSTFSTAKGTTRRRRKRAPGISRSEKENVVDNSMAENDTMDSAIVDLKAFTDGSRRSFLSATRSCAASSFWKKQSSSYVDAILECSRSLTFPHGPVAALLESYDDLLHASRQSVKAATEQKSFGKDLLSELLVATHALRALASILIDSPMTPIKLVYHVIVTISDRMQREDLNHADVSMAMSIVLAAFETLGYLLTTSQNFAYTSTPAIFGFPHPLVYETSADLRQLLKIGIQSTLGVCNVLSHIEKPCANSEFGCRVAKVLENKDQTAAVRGLVRGVVVPWTLAQAKFDDLHIELLVYAKAAHRLLWKIAANKNDQDDALDMRRDSIYALVLYNDAELDEQVRKIVSLSCSELACMYAWKASATYVQQTKQLFVVGSKNKPLYRFHSSVGSVLDKIAQDGSLSYVEYCAYRSLHVGIQRTTSSSNLDNFPYEYTMSSFRSLGEATLGLIFLVSSLQCELTTTSGDSYMATPHFYDSVSHLENICESVLANFQAVLSTQQLPENLRRCYKLLQQLMLTQRFSRQRKEVDELDTLHVSTLAIGAWQSCGKVLVSGIVAVLHVLIQNETDANLRTEYWDAIVEAYLRVVSLYDAFDSRNSDSSLASQIDLLIREIHARVDLFQPTFTAVERLAKLLFSVGKRRHDSGTHSILPLVVSIHWFTILESLSRGHEFARSRQLISRYSFLTSALISLDMKQAAILAIVAGLAYDSIDETASDPDPLSATFLFLMDVHAASASSRPGAKSLINRLITVYQRDDTSEVTYDKATLVSISERIVNVATGQAIIETLDVEALLANAFADVVRRSTPNSSDQFRGRQARTLGLLLASLGNAIRIRSNDGLCTSSLQQLFKSSSRLLYKVLKRTKGPNEQPRLLLGLVHFVTASSLIPDEDKMTVEIQSLYCNQLSRAARAFDESVLGGSDLLLGSLLRLDILYRQVCLSGQDTGIKLVSSCEVMVREFLTSVLNTEDEFQMKVWRSSQLLLSKIQAYLSLRGDILKASKVAYWNVRLSEVMGSFDQSSSWYRSSTMMYLKRADCQMLAWSLCGTKDSKQYSTTEHGQLFCVELQVANLRIRATTNAMDALNTCIPELLALSYINDDCQQSRAPTCLHLVRRWVESSRLLGLAEAYIRLQNGCDAIDTLKKCVKLCQGGARLLDRRLVDDFTLPFSPLSLHDFFKERQIECMLHLSQAYDVIGDYRKAEAYLMAASDQAGIQGLTGSRIDLTSLGELFSAIESAQQAVCFRSLVSLKAKIHTYQEIKTDLLASMAWSNIPIKFSFDNLEIQLEQLRALASMASRPGLVSDKSNESHILNMLISIESLNTPFSHSFESSLTTYEAQPGSKNTFGNAIARVKLCHARQLLSSGSFIDNSKAIKALCYDIIDDDSVLIPSLRALSFYYLGLVELGAARQSGELKCLWERNCSGDSHLLDAREAFEEGLMLVDALSLPLRRELYRSLALVIGPTEKAHKVGMAADELLHASIGLTSRIKALQNMNSCRDDKFHVKDVLEAEGDELFKLANQIMPRSWNAVAVALCPTGELLISGCFDGVRKCSCVFPEASPIDIFDSSIYNQMMRELDLLIQESDNQLNGLDENMATDEFSEESAKRDWWNKRNDVDDRLRQLLADVDMLYFRNQEVRDIFGASVGTMEFFDSEEFGACANLESKFDAASEWQAKEGKQSVLMKLTVAQLKEKLQSCGLAFSSKQKKADLVELLLGQEDDVGKTFSPTGDSMSMLTDLESTILILDENLHRFPFEGLPFLRGKAITRVPSLHVLLATLLEPISIEVDVSKVRYVIDPERNLGKTTDRIMPLIEWANGHAGWNWSGVVGEFPSEEFMKESVTEEKGLFFYCGHGGGRGSFSKSKVDSLVEVCERSRPCRSSIILMGCSSGKLASINRRSTDASQRVEMYYDPEGIALSYLLIGAPCVVGNLWDVTDRDIDRFCLGFMEKFLGRSGCSLAKCIAEARSCCKMQHIVGLAPVCYGLPVVRI